MVFMNAANLAAFFINETLKEVENEASGSSATA